MPRVAEGYVQLATRVRKTTMERLEEVIARTGRSLAEEIDHALNRHADQPPEVIIRAPALEPAPIEAGSQTRRGRPKKA